LNLPKGITGFRSIKDQELPLMDYIQFKQLSHTFVRELAGEIKGFSNPLSHRNYFSVECMLRGESYLVLLNCHHPFVAFALSRGEVSFLDIPALTAKYKPYYTVLTKEFLDTPISSKHLSTLSKAELEQVSYWKPKTVGEVIFNSWD
jgi:hypothetical protein